MRTSALWTWSLGDTTLAVRQGDLLAARERCWVNSEQTDFVLAPLGRSISAQLRALWPRCQRELDAQTEGRTHDAGTVLETSGPDGRRIFHAGFHLPEVYADSRERQAEHLEAIRSCVDQILDRVAVGPDPEVAFPLIGTGIFGVAVESFSQMFFEAVALAARRHRAELRISLVVWSAEDVDTVVQSGTQALAAMVAGGEPLLTGTGGHALVQQLRSTVRRQGLADLQERSLLRFAEFALKTDLAAVADASGTGVDLLTKAAGERRTVGLTFGLALDRLQHLAASPPSGLPLSLQDRLGWLRLDASHKAARRLVHDRNCAAHHAASRPTEHLLADIDQLFGRDALPEPWEDVPPGLWIRLWSDRPALLDRVDTETGELTWLSPLTRERFRAEVGTEGTPRQDW